MAVCVGCGLAVDEDTGVLEVQLKDGGGIGCDGDGLHVDFPSANDLVSDDNCNGIVRRADGLYSPCPDAIVGVHPFAGSEIAPLTVSTAGDAVFDWPSDVVTITNDLCCEVGGRISVRAGGPVLTMHDGFRGEARLDVNIDGDGYVAVSPDSTIFCDNSQGVDIRLGLNNLLDENYLVILAAAFHTYQARIHLHVTAGTAAVSGIPAFEFNWVLPQVSCCPPPA